MLSGAIGFSTVLIALWLYTGPGNDAADTEDKSLRSSKSLGECTDGQKDICETAGGPARPSLTSPKVITGARGLIHLWTTERASDG